MVIMLSDGDLILVLALSAGVFGLIYYLNWRKKAQLLASNKIIERNPVFFKRAHIFETQIDSIRNIGDAIDKGVLSSEKISFEPDYNKNAIIFHNKDTIGGSFAASLKLIDKNETACIYSFSIDAWREGRGSITRQDLFGANVLLTAIEKTILKLDPSTKVKDQAVEYKTKHSII